MFSDAPARPAKSALVALFPIDLLLAELTRRRTPVSVPIATRSKEFQNVRLDEAIYATGWDGSIVTLSVTGECYAATARFTLHPLVTDWSVSVEGGDLSLIGHETNVTALVLPARPDTVKVRIERNGTVVLDQVVSEGTECLAKELPAQPGDEGPRYAPGLCIFVRKEVPVDLCPDGTPMACTSRSTC